MSKNRNSTACVAIIKSKNTETVYLSIILDDQPYKVWKMSDLSPAAIDFCNELLQAYDLGYNITCQLPETKNGKRRIVPAYYNLDDEPSSGNAIANAIKKIFPTPSVKQFSEDDIANEETIISDECGITEDFHPAEPKQADVIFEEVAEPEPEKPEIIKIAEEAIQSTKIRVASHKKAFNVPNILQGNNLQVSTNDVPPTINEESSPEMPSKEIVSDQPENSPEPVRAEVASNDLPRNINVTDDTPAPIISEKAIEMPDEPVNANKDTPLEAVENNGLTESPVVQNKPITPNIPEVALKRPNFCPGCGTKLTIYSKFCPDCGYAFELPSSPGTAQSHVQAPISEEKMPIIPDIPATANTSEPSKEEQDALAFLAAYSGGLKK